jgi:hypothetical protein
MLSNSDVSERVRKMAGRWIAGYKVDEHDGVLINAPCGCYACSQTRQRGHPYCEDIPPALLKAEEEGKIARRLDSSWYWTVL